MLRTSIYQEKIIVIVNTSQLSLFRKRFSTDPELQNPTQRRICHGYNLIFPQRILEIVKTFFKFVFIDNPQYLTELTTVAELWLTTGETDNKLGECSVSSVITLSLDRFVLTARHCMKSCPCFRNAERPFITCRTTCLVKLR